jgi:hypothetical protein
MPPRFLGIGCIQLHFVDTLVHMSSSCVLSGSRKTTVGPYPMSMMPECVTPFASDESPTVAVHQIRDLNAMIETDAAFIKCAGFRVLS